MRSTQRPRWWSPALLLAGGALASACGGDGDGARSAAAARRAALPASLVLPSEPAGARPVREVVAGAKSGDEVVLAGRVGREGSDRAWFSLVDPGQKSCTELDDDCPTPWDFCCTPADEMARVAANVEFRDGGALYPGSVIGVHGIDHLAEVVVTGRAEKDDHGNLTVVATGIFVKK